MKFFSKAGLGEETEVDFLDRVDGWVAGIVRNQQVAFGDLLKILPGVYPSEVIGSLRRLEKAGAIAFDYRRSVESSVRTRPSPQRPTGFPPLGFMHLEHPLDFEWHFTKAAQMVIIENLRELCDQEDSTILCLGCPTLFSYGRRILTHHKFVLWDKNAAALGQLSEGQALSNINLADTEIPHFSADAAVLDPPWYNEFYKLFIWAALQSVRTFGKILLSFPPEGTRPSASDDLAELVAWCRQAGAEFVAHHRGLLPYRSPFFEMNALRAQGIYNVPLDWRRGDLVILEKRSDVRIPKPRIPMLKDRWDEHRIGSIRIKVRANNETKTLSLLRPVAKTAIMPSVSTRYPNREKASVVTTGNRFFSTGSARRVSALCQQLATGVDAHQREGRDPFAAISDVLLRAQLRRLVAQEQRELSEYQARTHDL